MIYENIFTSSPKLRPQRMVSWPRKYNGSCKPRPVFDSAYGESTFGQELGPTVNGLLPWRSSQHWSQVQGLRGKRWHEAAHPCAGNRSVDSSCGWMSERSGHSRASERGTRRHRRPSAAVLPVVRKRSGPIFAIHVGLGLNSAYLAPDLGILANDYKLFFSDHRGARGRS